MSYRVCEGKDFENACASARLRLQQMSLENESKMNLSPLEARIAELLDMGYNRVDARKFAMDEIRLEMQRERISIQQQQFRKRNIQSTVRTVSTVARLVKFLFR